MKFLNYLTEKKVPVDVYENPKGEEAHVAKRQNKYYIQVDNKYDLFIPNKKKLKEWIKSGRWMHLGSDIVYEQTYEGRTTITNGHSHMYRVDSIGSGFTTFDDTKHIHAIGVWKCKTALSHEHDIPNKITEAKIKKVKKPDFMTAFKQEAEYEVKEISPDVYQLAKFTHVKEPTETYRCQWTGRTWKCNCYSRKGSCKHIDYVQKFIKGKKRTVFDKWADKVIKL